MAFGNAYCEPETIRQGGDQVTEIGICVEVILTAGSSADGLFVQG